MTLETIFERLTDLDYQAQSLFRDIGLTDDCEFRDVITPNRADPDERFLCGELCDLMILFRRLHQELTYLRLPCSDEHVLRLFSNGRYGYVIQPSSEMRTFSCGSPVEALIYDEEGSPRWVCTRIEHNGEDYYLYGYRSISLNGLIIRERRQMV